MWNHRTLRSVRVFFFFSNLKVALPPDRYCDVVKPYYSWCAHSHAAHQRSPTLPRCAPRRCAADHHMAGLNEGNCLPLSTFAVRATNIDGYHKNTNQTNAPCVRTGASLVHSWRTFLRVRQRPSALRHEDGRAKPVRTGHVRRSCRHTSLHRGRKPHNVGNPSSIPTTSVHAFPSV
jgi:hypothetical protein